MTASGEPLVGGRAYEVGVAIGSLDGYNAGPSAAKPSAGQGSVPGFDDTLGFKRTKADGTPSLVEKGDAAVQAATEAIASQIGVTARRIAAAIGAEAESATEDQAFGLESVEVSFGVTLSVGMQTIFTAMTESSAQVTITLSRQAKDGAAAGSGDTHGG